MLSVLRDDGDPGGNGWGKNRVNCTKEYCITFFTMLPIFTVCPANNPVINILNAHISRFGGHTVFYRASVIQGVMGWEKVKGKIVKMCYK